MKDGKRTKNIAIHSAKECAYIAVFVALVLSAQLVFASVPGVELVTVLFVGYASAFGIKRGAAAATAFSLLRQLLFGFFPNVLILYLFYYNGLAALFGWWGGRDNAKGKLLQAIVLATLCAACFTLLDDLITPLWYGYTRRAARAYFLASLPVMLSQCVCAGVSVGLLFLPLEKAFTLAKRALLQKSRKKS